MALLKGSSNQNNLYDDEKWDKLVQGQTTPPHYIQSSAWGELKKKYSWPFSRLIVGTTPLQVYSRTVPGFGKLHYGPEVVGISQDLIPTLTKQIKSTYKRGTVFKLELYQSYSEDLLQAFKSNGWKVGNSVQPRHTVVVPISGTEDELLARYKKRARYEVRVGQKGGVKVHKMPATDKNLDLLASLIDETGKRSGAFFRKKEYLCEYWKAFEKRGQGGLYFAYHDGDLLAGAYVIKFGKTGWYKDGGSVRDKSNLMASRYLQWEIMRDLQSQGVEFYDLSGIPSVDELGTSSLSGLFAFKTGFYKETTRFMPAVELPLGNLYPFWPKAEGQFLRLYSKLVKDFWY